MELFHSFERCFTLFGLPLYSFPPVGVNRSVTGVLESKDFCTSYLTDLSMDFDGIWYKVKACWFDEPHISSFSAMIGNHAGEILMILKHLCVESLVPHPSVQSP